MGQPYRVVLTPEAEGMWSAVSDRRVRLLIREKVRGLAHDPELQGKPLTDDLSSYRSLRAAGQRYRIIYRVDRNGLVVLVVAIGLRKAKSRNDIYALARKLLRLRLIEPRR